MWDAKSEAFESGNLEKRRDDRRDGWRIQTEPLKMTNMRDSSWFPIGFPMDS